MTHRNGCRDVEHYHRRVARRERAEGRTELADFDDLLEEYCRRMADEPPRRRRRARGG